MYEREGQDLDSRNAMFERIYDRMKRLAAAKIGHESPGHTLQPTALVHEVYLDYVRQQKSAVNEDQALAFAARAMYRILVDHRRMKNAVKRGGSGREESEILFGDSRDDHDESKNKSWKRIALTSAERHRPLEDEGTVSVDLGALLDALEELRELNATHFDVLMLEFFGGMTVAQIAEQVEFGVTKTGQMRAFARGWLLDRLQGAAA